MKKLFLVIIFLVIGFLNSSAQGFLTENQKPKYLPKNKAGEYLKFNVDQKDGIARISIESSDKERDFKLYILKGKEDNQNGISWQIIAEFDKPGKKSFNKTYNDPNDFGIGTLYRIMVTDSDEKIEYTPIKSPQNEQAESSISGT
jgi:hypothetical protein